MARRKGSDLSVAQLERLLSDKKGELATLGQKKANLQAQLASVDKALDSLKGANAPAAAPVPARRKQRRRRLPRNAQSLGAVVTGILGKTPKGLSLKDLVAAVLSSGYKTKAKNFSNVVYQCVYNDKTIYRDDKSGTHRLKAK
ncbi:MAG: hypothetical protein VB861_09735 [Planctomycetaceae bacterium]